MTPRLTLKHPTGWFAAGREMQQALALLSDGAFKLYVYVCLHAERSSGRLKFRHSELAQSLGKSPRSITSYLNELRRQGVCQVQAAANQHQMGSIEIADRFWPYHKQLSEVPVCNQTRYIERVRQLFLSRAFSSAALNVPWTQTDAENPLDSDSRKRHRCPWTILLRTLNHFPSLPCGHPRQRRSFYGRLGDWPQSEKMFQ